MVRDPFDATPNIGPVLSRELREVDVHDPAELRRRGALEVTRLLYEAGLRDCRHALMAVEGAIRGIRWHRIPASERDALWFEFQVLVGC
ncbi:TfoX/Sxy family DNA transformation protein [Homoserinibacter sp. YIM 151385]|uniref:TfoX/Sxy family DNA transformation protein n=1 Tax=Homoserinibacter sp. YIM 151385 TaxID=2985506 RepID=UPI0022F05EFB|nr:TfoX/Sxy family DNA transformation protein [Homoserinibacter sp. YIM 151385]WBU37994.1 TfoX/Sxy family DNA transformation protein [Homoserinibacter sp. YIM 151385]